MKNLHLVLLVGLLTFCGLTQGYGQDKKIHTVVIDAGHGGRDPGAIGVTKLREKDVALSVSLKVGNYIKENFPDVKVVYTRDKDVFIPLDERGKIANEANADLFISIHANAFTASSVYGTEVFVLGLHKADENLETTKLENQIIQATMEKENSAITHEDNYKEKYREYDPNSPLAEILANTYQNAHLDQSFDFATMIDQQFKTRVGRKSRGVKQAGFIVLNKTAMPSVLVELGFLSNSKEETFLRSEDGKVYLASAIYRAFKEYKLKMDARAPSLNADELIVSHDPKTLPPDAIPPENKENVSEATANTAKSQPKDDVVFKVQFMASREELDKNHWSLKRVGVYDVKFLNGYYKYSSGNFTNTDAAESYQKKLRSNGLKEAFIVAYKDGKRVTIKEAKALLGN